MAVQDAGPDLTEGTPPDAATPDQVRDTGADVGDEVAASVDANQTTEDAGFELRPDITESDQLETERHVAPCDVVGEPCGGSGVVGCNDSGRPVCEGARAFDGFIETAELAIAAPVDDDAEGLGFGEGWGVAVGDFNGDGTLDILTGGADQAHLFVGRGDFAFEEVEAGLGAFGRAMNVTAADVDSDGDLDVLLTRFSYAGPGGAMALAVNEGGTFVVNALPLPPGVVRPTGVAWGDLDGDGDLDAYLGGFFGSALLRNDEGVLVHAPEVGVDRTDVPVWQPVWFDADADDDLDLLVYADKGFGTRIPGYFFDNDAGELFDITRESGFTQPADAMGVGLGDLNADGLPDVLISNTGSLGPGQLLFDSLGPRRWALSSRERGASYRRLVGWGVVLLDWDNDGDLDAAIAGEVDAMSNGAWLAENVNGRFVTLEATGAVPRSATYGVARADFDGDGRLDLVWATQSPGVVARVFRNRWDSGDWLRVRVGSGTDSAAVGATVEVRDADRVQVRYVTSGESYLSTHEPVAHFGFGALDAVDAIEVRWPDGRSVRVPGPTATGRVVDVAALEER